MDSIWAVIFIWVGLLWPVIVATAFCVLNYSTMRRLGTFFWSSMALGYLWLYGVHLFSTSALPNIREAGIIPNPVLSLLDNVAFVALFFAMPVVLAYFLAKRIKAGERAAS